MEEQPYVDYVTDFQLIHDDKNDKDKNEVKGKTAGSILVSAPASDHTIQVIPPSEDEESRGEEYSCGRKA